MARAGALELLDNLLEGPTRNELLRALDQVALEGRNLPRPDREESRRELAESDDPWLRAVVAHAPGGPEVPAAPAELRC